MNELAVQERQLPDNLPDLAKFALIGREKLKAVRAEIKAIEKVGLAKEVHEQKLLEAQEIAEAVLDAEVKIGELTAKIEKVSGTRTDLKPINSGVERLQTKTEALQEIGIPQHTAERFERLARHPQAVEDAKAEAREAGTVVTRQDVINRIVEPRKTSGAVHRDIVRKAREEIEEYENRDRTQKAVSFSDKKLNKINADLINSETQITISKIRSATTTVDLLSDDEITKLWKSKTEFERRNLRQELNDSIKVIAHVLKLSEVTNG